MRVFIYIASAYLAGWAAGLINLKSIPKLKEWITEDFSDTKIGSGIVFVIIIAILETRLSARTRNSKLTQLALFEGLGVFSISISIPKLLGWDIGLIGIITMIACTVVLVISTFFIYIMTRVMLTFRKRVKLSNGELTYGKYQWFIYISIILGLALISGYACNWMLSKFLINGVTRNEVLIMSAILSITFTVTLIKLDNFDLERLVKKFIAMNRLDDSTSNIKKAKFKDVKRKIIKSTRTTANEIKKTGGDVKISGKLNLKISEKGEVEIENQIKDAAIVSVYGKVEAINSDDLLKFISDTKIKCDPSLSLEAAKEYLEEQLSSQLKEYIDGYVGLVKAGEKTACLGAGIEPVEQTLYHASVEGDTELVRKLIKENPEIDINKQNEIDGWNPLLIAVANKHKDTAKYLLSKGASADARNYAHGAAPMHFACKYGFKDICKQLIEYGANINIRDDYGKTPLMYASEFGHFELVQYLIVKGANKKIKDLRGMSAFEYAKKEKYGEILRILVKK